MPAKSVRLNSPSSQGRHAASKTTDWFPSRLFRGFSNAFTPRWQLYLLGAVLLASLVIRLYRLGDFPDTVLGDEADNVQAAARIVLGDPPLGGFFGVDWTPQPAFSVYKQALFIAIFGFNVFTLRLPSAIGSALTLIPFYFLVRRQLSITASMLTTLLLSTSVWYLNFSRSGWNNVDVCGYLVLAMFCLLLALDSLKLPKRNRRVSWVCFGAAGFASALGLYAYPSGRAITLAVAAFFPIAWLLGANHRRNVLVGYILLFAVEATVFAPEALFITRHWEHFNGRTNVVLIFNQPFFKTDPVGTMLRQLSNNVRAPWSGRVNNTPQYSPGGEPQLDPFAGVFALAGMALTILVASRRRQGETWLWWLMLLSMWALTQLLSAGTPNGARGVGYLPALIFFSGIGLDGFLHALRYLASAQGWRKATRQAAVGIFIAIGLAFSAGNVIHYVEWQSRPQTRQQRYIYLTTWEFPLWAEDIIDRALNDRGLTNLGEWRAVYPIADPAHPFGLGN
jgi:4-amino-4-deoxy-L-arabinose transferase-like glycosyltransferase